MFEEAISVHTGSDEKATLDAIVARPHRDLSLVIDEALSAYLHLHAWQLEHIKEGIRQADEGEFAPEAEVREAFTRWRRSGRSSRVRPPFLATDLHTLPRISAGKRLPLRRSLVSSPTGPKSSHDFSQTPSASESFRLMNSEISSHTCRIPAEVARGTSSPAM